MIITEPGVYDIPEDEYHADPVPGGSLSSSGARKLLPPSCPALFHHQLKEPHKPTADMELGTAAHKAVLGAGSEPVLVDAENWRTNAAKEARDEARAAGRVPLLPAAYAQVQAMAAAFRAHPHASALIGGDHGKPEQSLFWRDPETGIWCRARLDWLPEPGHRPRLIVADLKTTKSADRRAIAKSVTSYGYHQQAAFYIDGARALGLDDDPAFVFAFQETDPPYLVTLAELDDEALRAGRARNREAIERYRDCMESGIWPGHSADIELITLPTWATRTEEYA